MRLDIEQVIILIIFILIVYKLTCSCRCNNGFSIGGLTEKEQIFIYYASERKTYVFDGFDKDSTIKTLVDKINETIFGNLDIMEIHRLTKKNGQYLNNYELTLEDWVSKEETLNLSLIGAPRMKFSGSGSKNVPLNVLPG